MGLQRLRGAVFGRPGLGSVRGDREVAEHPAAALGHDSLHHLAQLPGLLSSQWHFLRGWLLPVDEVRDHVLPAATEAATEAMAIGDASTLP